MLLPVSNRFTVKQCTITVLTPMVPGESGSTTGYVEHMKDHLGAYPTTMSTRATGAWQWLERLEIDRLAAGIGLLLALAMVPLRFVLTTVYAETFPVALLVACGLYLLARRTNADYQHLTLSANTLRFLGAGTFLGLSAMVALAAIQSGRGPLFYDLAILTSITLFAQIIFSDDADRNATFILVQILALAYVIRFAALYTTPGYIGIDIWTHVTNFAAGIQETHSINAINGKYAMAPFYHLIVALTAMIGDVALRTALYLTVALVVPLGALFVFATAREFVTPQWALLACALYAIGDDVIEWGIHPIPTSLGLLLFLAGLYLLVRYLKGFSGLGTVIPLAIILIAITFTHQMSAFIFLVALGVGVFTQIALGNDLLYPDVSTRNAIGLFVFHAGLLSLVWSVTPYRGGSFTGAMVNELRETIETDAGLFQLSGGAGTEAGSGSVAPVDPLLATLAQYIDIIGLVVLFGVAVGGSLYVLHHRRAEQATVTLVGAIIALMTYSLGLPLLGINTFVPGRWIAFLYAPMAVIGVIGFGYFLRELPGSIGTALAILLIVAYPTSMILSGTATLDDPVFDEVKPQVAFSEAELASMETLGQYGDGATVRSDSPYVNALQRSTDVNAGMVAIPEGEPIPHQVVVYREYQTTGAPIFARDGETAIIRTSHERMCGGRSQTYDNGDVTVCVA